MGDGFAAALAHFGVECTDTVKERGAFYCTTPRGRLRLAKANDPIDAIQCAHALKEHLAQAGFPLTDRYVVDAEGTPFVHIGTDCYTLLHAPESTPLDPADPAQALQTLASFHVAARSFLHPAPPAPSLAENFLRGKETLAAALKQIRKQKQRSDFDILLLKNAPQYEARISDALAQLGASSYAALPQQFCHNLVKDDHFSCTQGGIFMSHFTAAAPQVVLHDLALFVRHFAAPQDAALDAYHAVNPLPRDAADILGALLAYPTNFIHIVEQYYAKKRTWIPGALIKRLEEEVAIP